MPKRVDKPNRLLHISLRDKVVKLLTPTPEEELTLVIIKNLISSCVLFSKTIHDLKLVLPEQLFAAIDNYDTPLLAHQSQEVINTFLVKHQEELKCLKTYLFTQLLLND
jgi:hypothetical protein